MAKAPTKSTNAATQPEAVEPATTTVDAGADAPEGAAAADPVVDEPAPDAGAPDEAPAEPAAEVTEQQDETAAGHSAESIGLAGDLATHTPADEPAAAEPNENATLDLNAASVIPMFHPDGGTCDAYESEDRDGVHVILVPANDAASMIEHGFRLHSI